MTNQQDIVELEIKVDEQTLELEALKREWQTSEDLLAGSQRDNEEKHSTIERMKVYIKNLETLLGSACGPNWRQDHNIEPLQTSSTSYSASTPLPKPALSTPLPKATLLRHSVSISSATRSRRLSLKAGSAVKGQRRASYTAQQARMDAAGLGALREGEEGEGMDETPTAGIRKVMSRTASSGMSAKRERDSDREIDATTGSESVASGHEQGAEAEAFPPAPSGQPKQEAMMLQYLKEAEERLVQRLALLDETLLQAQTSAADWSARHTDSTLSNQLLTT